MDAYCFGSYFERHNTNNASLLVDGMRIILSPGAKFKIHIHTLIMKLLLAYVRSISYLVVKRALRRSTQSSQNVCELHLSTTLCC